jgi:cellulose biosynthesis protein BcsQ
MKSVVFFNNKGGVGKTTLSTNVAGFLALEKKQRVLYVDADPQCNSTQLFYTEEECEDILNGNGALSKKSLFHLMQPIMLGENKIDPAITPLPKETNKYGLDVIACHPKMSLVEDRLSDAWFRSKGGDPGGVKITNWCHQLLENYKDKYDLIIFDVGPSLGALNRSILLAVDFLVVPMGCDIFSVMGLSNISEWVKSWRAQYINSLDLLLKDVGSLDGFEIVKDIDSKHRLVGYSVQQYYTKVIDGERRAINAYDKIMKEIPSAVATNLKAFEMKGLKDAEKELGHIPYLFSLPPISQSSKTPIFRLTGREGIVGAQYKHVTKYEEMLNELTAKLYRNMQVS